MRAYVPWLLAPPLADLHLTASVCRFSVLPPPLCLLQKAHPGQRVLIQYNRKAGPFAGFDVPADQTLTLKIGDWGGVGGRRVRGWWMNARISWNEQGGLLL